MKKSKITLHIIVLLTVLPLTFGLFCLTAFAADEVADGEPAFVDSVLEDGGEVGGENVVLPEDGDTDSAADEDGVSQPDADVSAADEPQDGADETPADSEQQIEWEETEAPAEIGYVDDEDSAEPYEDYVEPISSYVAPENLWDLPEIMDDELFFATEVQLPDIEVSQTSLLGGVIAWLCVAVGIAVIAGVLVSKRTKRRQV